MEEFNLNSINLGLLSGFTGQRLCTLTSREFLDLAYIKEHGQTLQHCFERIRALGKKTKDVASNFVWTFFLLLSHKVRLLWAEKYPLPWHSTSLCLPLKGCYRVL